MGAEVVSCKNAHRCQCVAQPDIDDGVLLQESGQNCVKCGVLIADVTPCSTCSCATHGRHYVLYLGECTTVCMWGTNKCVAFWLLCNTARQSIVMSW